MKVGARNRIIGKVEEIKKGPREGQCNGAMSHGVCDNARTARGAWASKRAIPSKW